MGLTVAGLGVTDAEPVSGAASAMEWSLGVGVAVGSAWVLPEGQLPLTLITICISGKPKSPVGIGSGVPQSAALR